MKKGNLFLDFDGLKFDTLPAACEYFNTRYGIKSVISDYLNNGSCFEKVLKRYLPDDDIQREVVYSDYNDNFVTSISRHENILPMDGMCDTVKALSDQYVLWTVTARFTEGINVMQYLLDKYIPGCISGIHCVNQMKDGAFQKFPKKDFIANITGRNIGFIDDSLSEVMDMMGIVPSYLYDPDKVYQDVSGINVVHSWEEIGEKFL